MSRTERAAPCGLASLPELGVGLSYLPGLEPLLAPGVDRVAVLEVEPEAFSRQTPRGPEPFRMEADLIERLRGYPQPKLVHGVGYPVGGHCLPEPRHLPELRRITAGLSAAWASGHLSFNEAFGPEGRFRTGFLLPPRQTPEGAEAAAATIRQVAACLPVPFAVETGVNYLRPRPEELTEGAFVEAVAEAADCGILLDLHNLWANERNGRQAVREFLTEISLERVWEVHVAGGFELDGYWLDAHSGALPQPLAALAEEVLPRLPELRAVIFELSPQFLSHFGLERVRQQLEGLWRIWERRRAVRTPMARAAPEPRQPRGSIHAPDRWEATLGALVVGRQDDTLLGRELAEDPGLHLLRKLVSEFRAGMAVDALPLTMRLLLLTWGEARLRALLRDFWRTAPPELFVSAEGHTLGHYLGVHIHGVPFLDEVLAFERALIHTHLTGERTAVRFRHEPSLLLSALAQRKLPPPLKPREHVVEVGGPGDA